MSTHYIYFYGEITKIILKLSPNILLSVPLWSMFIAPVAIRVISWVIHSCPVHYWQTDRLGLVVQSAMHLTADPGGWVWAPPWPQNFGGEDLSWNNFNGHFPPSADSRRAVVSLLEKVWGGSRGDTLGELDCQNSHSPREFDRRLWHRGGTIDVSARKSQWNYV